MALLRRSGIEAPDASASDPSADLAAARDDLTQATQAVDVARAAVAQLEARAAAGEVVDTDDYLHAQAAVHLAEARIPALQDAARRATETDKIARAGQLAADYATWRPEAVALVGAKVQAARAALDELLASVGAFNREIAGYRERVRQGGDVVGVAEHVAGIGLRFGRGFARELDGGITLAAATAAAFGNASSGEAAPAVAEVRNILVGIAAYADPALSLREAK